MPASARRASMARRGYPASFFSRLNRSSEAQATMRPSRRTAAVAQWVSLMPRTITSSADVDRHRLHLGVVLDSLPAALAAEARLLEPAEGNLVVVAGGVVHADQAVLEALAHPHHARQVPRIEVGGQAEGGLVGAAE